MPADHSSPTVNISLTVSDSAAALDYYTKAYGAKELFRMPMPGGGIAHAEFMIGDTRIYISDASEEWHAFPMAAGTKASCLFAIGVEDCDAAYEQAVGAGAEGLSAPQDQFWGARTAITLDPFGYRWSFTQITEEVSPEEMMKRAQALFG